MLVNSIDPLAPYKASDDLVLELVSATAIIKDDSEGAAAAPCRGEIIEPHNLTIHQPPGGYMLDSHQVQMTCAKSAGVCLGSEIKFRVVHLPAPAEEAERYWQIFPPVQGENVVRMAQAS